MSKNRKVEAMQSEQIDKLAEALAKAQGKIENPPKNKTVSVTTRTGGRYEFSYADLTAIMDAIKKPLADNGLSYVQYVEEIDGKYRLITQLLHSSGQWISGAYPLFLEKSRDKDGNELPPSSQQFGSAQTFMKRYALSAMVGVAADSDDDANAADGHDATVKDRGRRPKEPAPTPVRAGPQAEPVIREPSIIGVPPDDNGSPDWLAWGREFMLQAKSAPTKEAAFRWLTLNQEGLIRMESDAPKMFPKLKSALAEVYPVLILKKEQPEE